MGIKTIGIQLSLVVLLKLAILLLLFVVGCGGGGHGGVNPGSGSGGGEPTVDVSFPLPNSDLAGFDDRITLRGRAEGADGATVTQILINNRTFSVPIPGSQGQLPELPSDLPDGNSWG